MREIDRRSCLERAAATAGVTGAALNAGCLSNLAGGGANNTDGGNDSDDDNDANNTDGGNSGDRNTKISIVSAPTPTTKLEVKYLREETNILEGVMDEIGYDSEVQLTWDELPQFLGGNADIAPSMGTTAAANLAVEREFNLTAHARSTPQHTGLYVRKGSDYDPDEIGGKQAAVDNIVQDGAKFGIGGWGLGTIPAYRFIFKEKYGYDFSQEGEFNVVTGEFPTLSRSVANGDIAAAGSGPPYGLWDVRDKVKPLFWNQEELPDIDFHKLTMCISNGITKTSFAEEHPKAVAAWFGLEKRAHEHMANNVEDIASRDSVQKSLNVPSKEAAAWVLDFRYNAKHTNNEYPASLQEIGFIEDRIETDKNAIKAGEELGFIESGWEESLNYNANQSEIQKYYEMAKEHE